MSKEHKDEQLQKILSILVTLDVSKLHRFNELNNEHPENIPSISVT